VKEGCIRRSGIVDQHMKKESQENKNTKESGRQEQEDEKREQDVQQGSTNIDIRCPRCNLSRAGEFALAHLGV
jgi:hypothetical protein